MVCRTAAALADQKLKSAIIRDPLIAKPDTTVMSAIALMDARHNCESPSSATNAELHELHQSVRSSCIFVVDAGRVIGVLTERLVVRLVSQRQSLDSLLIKQVMAPTAAPVRESALSDASATLDRLQQQESCLLPVLDDQDHLVGFVTSASLAGTLSCIRDCYTLAVELSLKNVLLAQIADNVPLAEILKTLAESIEQSLPGAMCSILLVDQHGRLREGASPSLPAQYVEAIDGVGIGEGVGSCGTAATRKETVIVSNIAKDRLWQGYKDVALASGLQACWSTPILTHQEDVLGTFAVYYPDVRSPQSHELETIAQVADIAGVAIRHYQTQVELQTSEARWQFALEGAGAGVWDWNAYGDPIFFSRQWKAMLGYEEHEIGDRQTEWENRIHPDDRERVQADIDSHCRGETAMYENEHRLRCKDGSYKWVLTRGKAIERAANGDPIRMLGIHTDISDRKRAEAALQKSEAQSRAILAAIPDFMLRVGADGVYREFVTPHRAFDLCAEGTERVGRSLADLLPAEVANRQLNALQQVLQTAEPYVYEQCIQVDERLQYEEIRVVKSGDDEVLFMMRDISDRKRTEAALRESEARLQFALEAAGAGVWDWNTQTNTVFFSQRWKAMLGYEAHELGSDIEEWRSRIHPDDRDRVAADTERHNRGVTPAYASEYRLRCKDGSYKWIASRGKVIERTATGEPLRIIGFHTDISDRKRTEAALIESEQRFRSLFESTPKVSVQGYNRHRQVIYWNEASEQLYGYAQEEVIGQQLEDLIIPPDMRQPVIEDIHAWVEEGQPIPACELNLMRKDGSRVTVFSSHIMVANAHGEPEMYCVDIDLSAAKKAEAQLQMLVAGTANTTGQEFFPALASCIASALEVTHVVVAERVGDQLHTLAFWSEDALQPGFSYDLTNTPCEQVFQDGQFYCEDSVQHQFPKDLDLAAMGAESYLGIVLRNAQGQPIGHLCILHQHPIHDPHRAEQILRIFAARAAAELERQRALTALEHLNQSLEDRVQQRTAELQEQKQFLETLLDSFPLSVFWKDRNSVYQGGNCQFLEDAGVSSVDAIIGKTDHDMPWRNTEAEKYRIDDQAVMTCDTGLVGIVETQTQENGHQIWVETNKIPLHDLNGKVIGVLGTYQDISDRKQAELELQQLTQELTEWRDRYDVAAQASGQVLFEYDLETDQDTWGPNFEAVLGHQLDRFPKGMQAYFNQIHPDDQAAYQCVLDNDRTIKEPYQIEFRFRATDGTYRWIEERGMTRYDAQGDPVQVIGYLRDISDRKRTEAALIESEAKSRAILAAIPDLILRVDSEGVCREFVVNSPYVEALFEGNDPVGVSMIDILPAELISPRRHAITQALHTGELQVYEQQLQVGDCLRHEEVRVVKSGDNDAILMIRDISDRKQAEFALRDKTEELDRFFSLALDLLCIVKVDGQFVRLNSQWEKTLGYPLTQLEGSQFLDYVHPDDLTKTLQTFTQTRAGEEVLNFVNRYRCHDGSYRWIEWRSATHGELIYAAARDITERKQAEAKLRNSRAYYRSIVTDQTELICRFLPDGTLTFVNKAYCDFFQQSRRSLIGFNFLRLLPETDAVIATQRLSSMSPEEPVCTCEHQVFAPDGTLRWQQWTDRALFDPNGNLLEFQSVGRDITALKEAEAALRDSEQRFRRAIENAPFPIIIHAEDGEVLQINTAWTDLSGYTHQAIPTIHTWTQQAYGDQAATILENIARTYTLESRWDEGEVTITTRDGNRRIWRFSSAPLGPLPDGRRAVISMAADMTQYRQAELALRESEARWQFALEGAGHGVWDWDIQTNSVFLSPQLKAMLGYAEAEIESSVEVWNNWIHPEDKVYVECEINRYLSNETSTYQNEHRLRCKDGSYKWILDRATVIEHTANGDPLRMIGTHTDITERKQRELESRLLASVVESSEDAIITQDLNGIITSWNTGAVNLFSHSQAEAIGQSITILVPLDWPSDMTAIFESREQEQSIKHFETVCCRNNSMPIDVAVTVAPLRAKDGTLTGTSIIVRDITERKQIEAERLRAEETRKAYELLERVMDNVLAGYWDWDIPNGKEYFSPGFKRMFGYADHELPNTPESWQRLIFPEDFSIAQKCFERHIQSRGKAPYYIEVRYRHKNGSTVWVICSGQVVEWDEMGAPLRMIGCHIDMSDRKQAEDYIRRESTFRQQIVEHMAEGLCVCHEVETFPFLHFTVWNSQMQAITGYSLEEINRLGWYQTLFPNSVSQQQAIERVERMQRGEILTDEEWYIQRKDGEQRAIAISTSVLSSHEGETYILALMQDITVRKQAKAQLQQTNKELARATRLKDEFLANMSHELRTPLNAILGITEGLQENAFGELSPDQLDALGTIERSGSYLLDLINDILDVAKIEAGQIQLDKTWVSVAALCQSSVAFVKQPAWKKDIQLDLQLPRAPLYVYVDERRMRQVLLNLLDNAVKFTPTGGKITLQAMAHPFSLGELNTPSVTSDTLRLMVSDTGIGIARDRIDSLFEPFVQIDSALSRQNTGTGLGLALVKRIVELHEGIVAVTSELGTGSCFMLDLPCQFSAVAATHIAVQSEQSITYHPSPAAATPLILLAEDNEANIKTTSRYLIAKGYRIALARTGEEAVALASSEQPQLILMDIQMPQMDGLEAIQQIRQNPQLPDLPIIALTALAMSGDHDRCLAAGADEYLSKPVKLQKLVALIQRLLARAAEP